MSTCPPSLATDLAEQLFGFFHGSAVERIDPDRFVPAIAGMLASYPEWVGRSVVNPINGLPSRLRFFPSLAEVKDACEDAYKWERARLERDARQQTYLNRLPAPEPPDEEARQRAVERWENTIRPQLAPEHMQPKGSVPDDVSRARAQARLDELAAKPALQYEPAVIGDGLARMLTKAAREAQDRRHDVEVDDSSQEDNRRAR